MGFFNNLKKTLGIKGEPEAQAEVSVVINKDTVNGATQESNPRMLDLKKKVKVVLEKNNLVGVKARIVLMLDKSGSMGSLYRNGTVQATVERLVAVASQMSTSETMDVWLFNTRTDKFPSVSEQAVDGYVDGAVLSRSSISGGTSYAPAIESMMTSYGATSNEPTLVFFITDGENDDYNGAKRAITTASGYPIFFQFIGLGDENFEFLSELDTMEGRLIDNANFFPLNDLKHISDEQLYERILVEFPSWIKLAKGAGILK